MAAVATCIYCPSAFNPDKGEGDHIIPVQLGEFRNDVRFRRICPSCNAEIGASEQQLLTCGPENFLRRVVNPTVPARRRRGRSRARSAMGAPGPESTIDHGDHHQLVEPTQDPRDAHPLDQIVIHDEQDNEHFIRLFPRMRPEQLKKRLDNAGITSIPKAWLHCDAARWEEYQQLFKAVWPKARIEEMKPTEAGVHRMQGHVKLTVTDHYFRAIAKIGFHYYLAHSRRRFRGDEDCFAPIRNFIMNGGNSNTFFHNSGRTFAMPFGKLPLGGVVTPKQWSHILAADESGSVAVIYVQLFVGRGYIPSPHYLTLGRIDSPLVVPSFTWGHVYLYDDPQQPGKYAGRVEDAQITRFR